jgi:WD40 repeat protein
LVSAIAISPDGTWLATTSSDETARIWDAATGQHRATLTSHTSLVSAIAISPDGTWLATTSSDRTARIWDAATGQVRAIMRVEQPLGQCVWNPSGQSLACGGDAGLYHFTFKQ